jgi:purine-cytosine permease-like protein
MEKNKDDWTWRDTLARLQHIDKIVETIVTRAIALNVGLIAVIAAIITGNSSRFESLLPYLAIPVFIINIILAFQLARQQCIHQFYFKKLRAEEKLEHLLPPEYRTKYEKEIEKNTDKSNGICSLGKMPYVITWIVLLVIMNIIYPYLLVLPLLDC